MQTVPADRREPRSARDYVDTAALRLASCRHDRSSALQSSRAPERSRGASSLPRRVMAGHPQVAEHSGRVPHRLGDLRTLVRRGQNRAARGRNTGQARRRRRGAVLRCAARRTRGKLGPRLLEERGAPEDIHIAKGEDNMSTSCAELDLPMLKPMACLAWPAPPAGAIAPLLSDRPARSRRQLLLAMAGGDSRPAPPHLGRPPRRPRRRVIARARASRR
jgi:hypothetical protein